MYKDTYVLADCNNFFVSCERVFNPKLNNKPVAILSNNDGCVIARSDELKQMGVPMGVPLFKWADIFRERNVAILSANFSLYQDMSQRIYNCFREFSEEVEVYSIDEAFLRLTSQDEKRIFTSCQLIKKTIYKWTGIPISLGIAKTKTLSKLANKIGKKFSETQGIFFIESSDHLLETPYMAQLGLSAVWGIGFRIARRLKTYDIYSFENFINADRHLLKQIFGVGLERTWLELHGVRCFPLKPHARKQKSILCSRTFKEPRKSYDELLAAISSYTQSVGRTLRKQHSVAGNIGVFLQTRYHPKNHHAYYNNFKAVPLETSSNYTPTLISHAKEGLSSIFKEGYEYKRAGVILTEIFDEKAFPQNLFIPNTEQTYRRCSKLMGTFYSINTHWGKGTIELATQQLGKNYVEQRMRSSRYTTNWLELKTVSSI